MKTSTCKCGKKIYSFPSQKRKFCSQGCYKKNLKGKQMPWLNTWRHSKRSPEFCTKISRALKGKKKSKKHIQNQKISLKIAFKNGRKVWNQGKANPSIQGENHRWWRGGKFKTKAGYIKVYSPGHPYARNRGAKTLGSGGYVFEHRLVVEKFLSRYLLPEEKVHHRNGIKDDNRIENLQLIANKPHYGEVKCPSCHYRFLVH